MRPVLLELPEQRWECPSCDVQEVTREARRPGEGSARMHRCRGLAGLTAPLVPAGTRAEHRMVEREDYIGRELVQYAPGTGRPVMNITTVRDDGQDCTVYAPTARASGVA